MRSLPVETLALKIGKEPCKVVARLRETPAGIDWLLARWRVLSKVESHGWSDLQRDLAATLTGGNGAVDPSASGFVASGDRPLLAGASAG